MNATSTGPNQSYRLGGIVRAVVAAALIAGTIDIVAAALISHLNPLVVLRFIAGGMLGKAALHGDMTIPLLGLLLQWAMSALIAAVFIAAAHRMRGLLRHSAMAGLGYGVVVFLVMNYVVVPLSAWHHVPSFKPLQFVENLLAMLLFGLIVSACAKRFISAGDAVPPVMTADT